MCDPKRPQTGIQSMMPGARMMSPVSQTSAPSVAISMVQSPYGLIPAHPPQYMTHMTYPHQLPNVPGQIPLVSAVPSMLPGMYVPVPQVPGTQILSNPMSGVHVPAGLVPANIDSSKLVEHQKKLEKERNFQMQQQRLKQFTVAGKKESMNAENLIDNMFGKSLSRETSKLSSSSQQKPKDLNESKQSPYIRSIHSPPVSVNLPHSSPIPVSPASVTVSSFSTEQKSAPSTHNNENNKKKNLDVMMLECSDLSGPQKANKFIKPSVKEIAPTTQLRSTFAASDKARNWSDVKGLDSVFVAKRPRFPAWCCKSHVPELYHKIEEIVTQNGAHMPETNLLFPILLSSQLPQQLLAQIWELVNQSGHGHLTVEEMYAALALIALVQAGHMIKTVDILHQLPSCPIPHLQPIMTPEPINADNEQFQTSSSNEGSVTDSSAQNAVRPSSLSCGSSIASNFIPSDTLKDPPCQPTSSASEFVTSPDDEFDDFKSATPTCVSFVLPTNSTSSISPDEDEFDDFKQAPSLPINSMVKKEDKISISPPAIEQDLMSPEEDKYSVFRLLQQSDDVNSWGEIASTSTDLKNNSENEIFDASDRISLNCDLQKEVPTFSAADASLAENVKPEEDDEFGDFLHAEIKQDPSVFTVTNSFQNLDANFADFSQFNENPAPLPALNVTENAQLDDEFGEFTSSLPVCNKFELGHEFLFNNLKDNISLAESQSVSSLELGTFDGNGHSGESKSSMSRQGSIPSLDLKSTNTEAVESEDCFGELQSALTINKTFKIPSPPNEIKVVENSNSSGTFQGINIQTPKPIPLVDKYSVIRSEDKKEEDPYISSWNRCIQSSVCILQNTSKIFNKMSCSAVCNEVLSSEEGGNYVKDVIEIYKIICRITLSSKTYGKQTTDILNLLKEADQIWNSLSGFFTGSDFLTRNSYFDFSSALLDTQAENNGKACGLCLLNIESKNSNNEDGNLTLSYGGRNYHSTCANFWVNCVDPLLPALNLPQLL